MRHFKVRELLLDLFKLPPAYPRYTHIPRSGALVGVALTDGDARPSSVLGGETPPLPPFPVIYLCLKLKLQIFLPNVSSDKHRGQLSKI